MLAVIKRKGIPSCQYFNKKRKFQNKIINYEQEIHEHQIEAIERIETKRKRKRKTKKKKKESAANII